MQHIEQVIDMNWCRKQLLVFTYWLQNRMHNTEGFSRNDPEWIETQNELTRLINSLKRQIKD